MHHIKTKTMFNPYDRVVLPSKAKPSRNRYKSFSHYAWSPVYAHRKYHTKNHFISKVGAFKIRIVGTNIITELESNVIMKTKVETESKCHAQSFSNTTYHNGIRVLNIYRSYNHTSTFIFIFALMYQKKY